jgi:hypothetical protein
MSWHRFSRDVRDRSDAVGYWRVSTTLMRSTKVLIADTGHNKKPSFFFKKPGF